MRRADLIALVRHLQQHPDEIPKSRFERHGHSIRCVLDGKAGLMGSVDPRDDIPVPVYYRGTDILVPWNEWYPWAPWQIRHLLPHTFTCTCGTAWPDSKGLLQHIRRSSAPGHAVASQLDHPTATRPSTLDPR